MLSKHSNCLSSLGSQVKSIRMAVAAQKGVKEKNGEYKEEEDLLK